MAEDGAIHTEEENTPAERIHAADRTDLPPAETTPRQENPLGFRFVGDIVLRITVDLGEADMTVRDILNLKRGSIVELNKLAGEMIDISVQGYSLGRGEVMVISDALGVRLTEVGLNEENMGDGES